MAKLIEKLNVENLTKKFNGKIVFEDLSFSVYEGEFLTILGPSGCGKSTILRILIGLLDADRGAILLNDVNITKYSSDKREMGIVFQNYALFENMTVEQNIKYALKFHNKSKEEASSLTAKVIKSTGLEGLEKKYPRKLSGGQQQRVAIARTLVINPKIILFDEPLSALDVETRLVLRNEIKRIQEEYNTTMIYITHDQEEAFAMSDRIMIINDGVIHQIDTPENILYSPANEYVEKFVIENLKIKMNSLMKYVGKLNEKV
ncbi:MAG: ABC transporter ATP-binding protein [Bacilli bacterium]